MLNAFNWWVKRWWANGSDPANVQRRVVAACLAAIHTISMFIIYA